MFNIKRWINNGFNMGVDKPFEDLIENTEQRDQKIALWVLRFWDSNYESSSDFRHFKVVQAGREEDMQPGL